VSGFFVNLSTASLEAVENYPLSCDSAGAGVPPAQLEQIFEHFVSTKPNGLGMGLAISRSIVEVHGGRMWATANTDPGLTVHIQLPSSRDGRGAKDTTVEVG